jgi:hypothetical protein
MHLQIGDDLHGIVRNGKVVLVPRHCLSTHWTVSPEVKLPASAAVLFEGIEVK